MKKILITGGAGFVGTNLCEKLIKKNKIFCLDNLQTGSYLNIEKLIGFENFEFIKHDIINPIDIEVDTIFNLACAASPPLYQKDPIHTFKTSVIGTLNMLELAKKYNATFLQASTSEIYGDPAVHPQSESYWGNVNPIGIRSCYDEGKRSSETLTMDFKREYDLNLKIVRIFNTYGPYMNPDDGRVVSNFIVQALKNQNITVYGDGSQTRSFQYIDNLISGLIAMSETKKDFIGPVNLGNPGEFTILELAKKVIKMTNSKSKIKFFPLPQDDPKQRKPDISRAYNELNNWEPNIDLDKGLEKTIKYFSKIINEN